MENERRDPDRPIAPNGSDRDRAWVADQGLELHRLIARRRTRKPRRDRKGESAANESQSKDV
jgi:hypothetical protein